MTREPHASVFVDVRDLIAIRHREIVPLISSRYFDGSYDVADAVLKLEWRFEAGGLAFAASFADSARAIDLPGAARIIWKSPGATARGSRIHLVPWTGVSWRSAP
jgi:hypothetical protein